LNVTDDKNERRGEGVEDEAGIGRVKICASDVIEMLGHVLDAGKQVDTVLVLSAVWRRRVRPVYRL